MCAEVGVAICLVTSVPKAPIYGVARWINKKSTPLIQLTDRNKDYNSFWFSFYHELGHIMLHNKSEVFIEGLNDIAQDEVKEKEADNFAKRHLSIPDEKLNSLTNFIFLTEAQKKKIVFELSEELQLHPSIIISQLQRLEIASYSDAVLNQLKVKVEFDTILHK